MTDLLERAVTAARALSPEMQDEIARVVLALARDHAAGIYEFTAEEAAIDPDGGASARSGARAYRAA